MKSILKHTLIVGAATAVTAGLVVVFGLFIAGCSGNRQTDLHTAKDVIHLAEDACVLVSDVSDAGPANTVCAKEEDLKPFINLILGAQKAAAARKLDAGSDATR